MHACSTSYRNRNLPTYPTFVHYPPTRYLLVEESTPELWYEVPTLQEAEYIPANTYEMLQVYISNSFPSQGTRETNLNNYNIRNAGVNFQFLNQALNI